MEVSDTVVGLRVRLLLWLYFIAMSGVIPFAGLYYREIFPPHDGRDAMEIITILLVLQPLFSLFSNPLAGFIADKFKIENRMLLLCALLTAAGGLLIGLPGIGLLPGLAAGEKLILMGTGIVLLGLFSGPVFPIINTEIFGLIHKRKEADGSYGRYRVQGTLSWIVFTVACGAFLSLTGRLAFVFLFYGAAYFIMALTALTGIRSFVKPVRLPLKHLKKDYRFRRFIIYNFFHSFSLYGSLFFTGFFFQDANIDFLFIGIAFAVGGLFEVPIMFASRYLTARFGNRILVITGTAAMALKLLFLGLSVLFRQSWLIIPIMLIHGLGFGTQHMGVMNIINNLAHKDLRAIYLNLYAVIGVNVPWALGLVVLGWIINVFDSTVMMLTAGFFSILALLYFIFFVPRDIGRFNLRESEAQGPARETDR